VHILWLKTELLHPVDKGGKIRTYQMLKELKRDHQITYLTLDDGAAAVGAREQATEYCHEVITIPHHTSAKFSPAFYSELASNLLSPLPYAIKKYDSAPMRERVSQLSASRGFDLLVCDFLAPAVNVPRDVACPTVLFQHNVEAMIWKRHFEVQANPVKRAYLRGQWRKMRAFEHQSCGRFDTVVTVSRADREMIRREYETENVYDVPTGVDVEFFKSSGAVASEANSLVFTGSMDWLPNEDAIRYFTDQIMPLIKQKVSDVTLTVVGRNPYPGLLELSKHDDSIVVTGRVDDVRPFMEKAAVYIVPLRIGGGTRLKIFEAMAMEKAIVSTSIGAEGLPVRNDEELILADTPEAFAGSVVRLLQDQAVARRLGQRAAVRMRETFGWRRVAENFASICENAVNKPLVQNCPMGEEVFLVGREKRG
jgi:glycosyltransferase involved in cell wall biosynthesis